MLGRKERSQPELFVAGTLRDLLPDDHVLVRVDRVLDLGWLREEVADCYCLDNGRPGIDAEVAVRLMLAGLLTGIVHDRKLLREAWNNRLDTVLEMSAAMQAVAHTTADHKEAMAALREKRRPKFSGS